MLIILLIVGIFFNPFLIPIILTYLGTWYKYILFILKKKTMQLAKVIIIQNEAKRGSKYLWRVKKCMKLAKIMTIIFSTKFVIKIIKSVKIL